GQVPVEVRLTFDQPLNPARSNVPVALDLDPLHRSLAQRGRIWLEYDDPERGKGTWLPATVAIASNTLAGAVVVLRPLGVLPNAAPGRGSVLRELEDLSGQPNASAPGYDPVFAAFATASGYEPQFDAVVEGFDTVASLDLDAAFADPRAEHHPGYLK